MLATFAVPATAQDEADDDEVEDEIETTVCTIEVPDTTIDLQKPVSVNQKALTTALRLLYSDGVGTILSNGTIDNFARPHEGK